jgi:hypothetical protein
MTPPLPSPIMVVQDVADSPLMHIRVYCGRCNATTSNRTIDARTTTATDAAADAKSDAAAWLDHHCPTP